MAELWHRYESLILFDPDLGTEATEELIARAKEYITNESGRILKIDRWGMRDLAFVMKGRAKAYYVLLEFAGPTRAATELDRRLNLLDTVLKFQTIKLEERIDPDALPEEPQEETPPSASEPGTAEAEPGPAEPAEAAPESESAGKADARETAGEENAS